MQTCFACGLGIVTRTLCLSHGPEAKLVSWARNIDGQSRGPGVINGGFSSWTTDHSGLGLSREGACRRWIDDALRQVFTASSQHENRLGAFRDGDDAILGPIRSSREW
ncbi:hypothetical protein SRM_01679 [Salinibacter ruber M8]|uniref:Uncharacterized protein n=1 Tax=Salinibacter ruber (strain M8) TaxID=761659 RepID=D5H995_SALRM|nr:hypothetical protein SRM_01679 [Salinibacter ruber M8]